MTGGLGRRLVLASALVMPFAAGLCATHAWGSSATLERPDPCTVIASDVAGDPAPTSLGPKPTVGQTDIDITRVTYRLGSHYLTATISVPGLAQHTVPLWNQRASFWNYREDTESYDWQTADAERGTLPDPQPLGTDPTATAAWDDAHGVVSLRIPRSVAVTELERRDRVILGVQLDIQMSADDGNLFDGAHVPVLNATACDHWRAADTNNR